MDTTGVSEVIPSMTASMVFLYIYEDGLVSFKTASACSMSIVRSMDGRMDSRDGKELLCKKD